MDMQEVLRTRFGFDEFRPGQEEIVRDVLAGGNRLVVLPTGGGKSLCYLLPAGLHAGKTLVVSPLIALMEDQVQRAAAAGLRAVVWNRGTRDAALAAATIIFCSPEKMASGSGRSLLGLGIWHLVIDEAHCVEDWGGSFRPLYNQLAGLRMQLMPKSVSVFTASADAVQRDSLVRRLGLRNARSFVHGFDRPNIAWHCHRTAVPLLAAVRLLERRDGRAIVYCRTRLGASRAAGVLQAFGLDARPFHAGMRRDIRTELQNAFVEGRPRILCATSAFGMGVDVPSVRTVIHLGLPTGSNAYYQESGRAGRDGAAALAVLFFRPDEPDPRDAAEQRNHVMRALFRKYPEGWTMRFLEQQVALLDSGQDSAAILAFLLHHGVCRLDAEGMRVIPTVAARDLLEAAIRQDTAHRMAEHAWVTRYALDAGACRRRLLLGRFEDPAGLVCRGCDRCGSRFSGLMDSVLAQAALEAGTIGKYLGIPWYERPPCGEEERLFALQAVFGKAG